MNKETKEFIVYFIFLFLVAFISGFIVKKFKLNLKQGILLGFIFAFIFVLGYFTLVFHFSLIETLVFLLSGSIFILFAIGIKFLIRSKK